MKTVRESEKEVAKEVLVFFLLATVWVAALIYSAVYLSPVVSIPIAALPIVFMLLKIIYVAFIAEVEEE